MDHAAAGVESNMRLTDPSQLEYPAIRLGCGDRMQFDQLKRREFITLLGGAAATWPHAAQAQQQAPKRFGYLASASNPDLQQALLGGLRDLGVEGQNLAIEYRYRANSVGMWMEVRVALPRYSRAISLLRSGHDFSRPG